MRYVTVPAWLIDSGASDRAIRLYLAIRLHWNSRTGQCNPSRARLAHLLGWSVSKVDRSLPELEKLGAVVVKRSKAGKAAKGSYEANRYVVCDDPWVAVNLQLRSRNTADEGSRRNDARTNSSELAGGGALKAPAAHSLGDCAQCGEVLPLVVDDLYCEACG